MKKSLFTLIAPLIGAFTVVAILLRVFSSVILEKQLDPLVLQVANLILFVLAVVNIYMQVKAVSNKNPHVFTRSVLGGTIMKLFLLVGIIFLYLSFAGKDKNVESIFVAMVFYVVYAWFEVRISLQLNKKG